VRARAIAGPGPRRGPARQPRRGTTRRDQGEFGGCGGGWGWAARPIVTWWSPGGGGGPAVVDLWAKIMHGARCRFRIMRAESV